MARFGKAVTGEHANSHERNAPHYRSDPSPFSRCRADIPGNDSGRPRAGGGERDRSALCAGRRDWASLSRSKDHRDRHVALVRQAGSIVRCHAGWLPSIGNRAIAGQRSHAGAMEAFRPYLTGCGGRSGFISD